MDGYLGEYRLQVTGRLMISLRHHGCSRTWWHHWDMADRQDDLPVSTLLAVIEAHEIDHASRDH